MSDFFFLRTSLNVPLELPRKKIQVTPETPSGIPLQFSSEISSKVILKVFLKISPLISQDNIFYIYFFSKNQQVLG